MQTNSRNKTKIVYLEMLRVIVIFFVIFNHTADNGFFLFLKVSQTVFHFGCISSYLFSASF